MSKIKETLSYAISSLEGMSDIVASNPDNGEVSDDSMSKAVFMTAACAIIYEIYATLNETAEFKKLLIDNRLLERIDRRVLHITTSLLPYPNAEEVIEAGKAICRHI